MGDADNKHKHDTRAQITYPTRYCRQNTQTPMPHHHGKTEKYYHKISNLTHRYQHTKKRTLVDKRKRQRERETHTYTQHQTRSMSNHRPQKRPITDQQTQKFPQGKNPQIACFLTPPRHRNVTLNMSICFPVYHNIYDPKPLMQESTRRPTRPLPPIDLAPAWYNRWKDPVR